MSLFFGSILLTYVFYYVLAAILIFQGLHIASEITAPLGTLPEEVGQAPTPSQRWGSFMVTYGGLSIAIGLLSHAYEYFGSALRPLFVIGAVILAIFSVWVVFMGRKVVYMGEPSEEHGHSDAGHH